MNFLQHHYWLTFVPLVLAAIAVRIEWECRRRKNKITYHCSKCQKPINQGDTYCSACGIFMGKSVDDIVKEKLEQKRQEYANSLEALREHRLKLCFSTDEREFLNIHARLKWEENSFNLTIEVNGYSSIRAEMDEYHQVKYFLPYGYAGPGSVKSYLGDFTGSGSHLWEALDKAKIPSQPTWIDHSGEAG